MRGKENQQLSTGSASELLLHTEDAFHEYRGEYICFYCLRNPERVQSIFATIRDIQLPDHILDTLFENRFFIAPDDSHLDLAQRVDAASETYHRDLMEDENRFSLLYGNIRFPYLRFDPAYTIAPSDDQEAANCYVFLRQQVERNVHKVELRPGDVCLIDNRKVVHGRAAFKANYNGKGRWMKRINISSNLRRSAFLRSSDMLRVIGT
ncbi:TauD/TfdA family dioxygenase [Microbulbifer taiwanensis]